MRMPPRHLMPTSVTGLVFLLALCSLPAHVRSEPTATETYQAAGKIETPQQYGEGDVIFSIKGIEFPSPAADGCLFHWGGKSNGMWVGINEGKFVVTAGGDGFSASVTTEDFPAGGNHDVLIYVRVGDGSTPGQVHVYIDCDGKGVGTADGGPVAWTGTNEGSYFDAFTSNKFDGYSRDGWQVLTTTPPPLKLYAAVDAVALFPFDPTEFGCTGICNRTQLASCDANAECSINGEVSECTCNWPYIADGNACVPKYGYPPAKQFDKSGAIPDLGETIYKGDVAIVMEKIKFPSGESGNGCLFHFGGRTDSTWAGMLNGKFHVQAGASGTAVTEGTKYAHTAYVTIPDYPTDDAEHTVLVYISIGDAMKPGQIRVYIDCQEKAIGVTDGGALLGTEEHRWTGSGEGSYLDAFSYPEGLPAGTSPDAWPSLSGTESPLLMYTEVSHSNLFEFWTPAVFGCAGFCTSAEAATCDERAECSIQGGAATCTCPPFPWSGSGEECTLFGPPNPTRTFEVAGSDLPGLGENEQKNDAIFLLGGIKFPIISNRRDTTDQDGCLFHMGGLTNGMWVGINNGKFYVQAGKSDQAVTPGDSNIPNVAYVVIDDFPQDGEEHVVLIRVEVGKNAETGYLADNTPGKITVWIDCIEKGVGITAGLALGKTTVESPTVRFAGSGTISYLDAVVSGSPVGCSTNEWPGARGTEWPLRMYSNYINFSPVDFGCTGECNFVWGSQCDSNAACVRTDASFECSCNTGWEGDGATCTDIKECNMEKKTEDCHVLAFCEETPGSFTCLCQPGFVGDGYDCYDQSWGIRTVFNLGQGAAASLDETEIEVLKLTYGKLVLFDPVLPPNASVVTGMPFSFGALNFGQNIFEIVQSESGDLVTFFALFRVKAEAENYVAMLGNESASYWSPMGGPVTDGPEVYRWEAQTTSNALQVNPTGLTVDFVYFDPTCLATGCWKVEVTYTVGLDNFNVFFLARAVGSDQLSYDFEYTEVDSDWGVSAADTFFPRNHPCHSNNYDPDSGDLPASVTSCCIPQFLDMYRPVQNFYTALDAVSGTSIADLKSRCGTEGGRNRAVNRTLVPTFAAKGQTVDPAANILDRPAAPPNPELRTGVFIDSVFNGMTSYINHTGVVDAYIGIYTAILCLDEVELRTLAGQLKGTVGVEHTVDTFIGLAEFSPTGQRFLDPNAVQTDLHLEKTNFFSVSTHGVNDYTFLEYVNMRLVSIYTEDKDFSGVDESNLTTVRTNPKQAADYVQVTFTLGSQYVVNENLGLIPTDSVRAGKGIFFDDEALVHKCSQWTAGTFPNIEAFNTSLLQGCAPGAAMCVSPAAIPDQFVSYNIPLGVEWFDPPSNALDSVVFVHMVINAVDDEARQQGTTPNNGEPPWQMKTTLSASIPVVAGGINIFCDGITAKTDLKDVANVDIIVGSAANATELTRLRILEDVASTQLATEGPQQVDSDSIESGLMTMVIKGNSSYFELDGNVAVSVELEDVISIHIMENDGSGEDNSVATEVLRMLRTAPDDNTDTNGLITDGYALNEAFLFTMDRSAQRSHLEPSAALTQVCPWNPPRPANNNGPLITCVTRRDVQFRNYPWRNGGLSTAMEICGVSTPNVNTGTTRVACEDCCGALDSTSVESKFMATILGNNIYAKQLAVDFAKAVDERYTLNGRYRRAYWINPGYEWTPTQTGGNSIFQLSQKIFLYALITLDEDISTTPGKSISADRGFSSNGPSLTRPTRRRMILQSGDLLADALKDAEAGAGNAYVQYKVTPKSMMASAFNVPEDRVATWKVSFQLTEQEACMSDLELQAHLRDTLADQVTKAVSAYKSLQVTSLVVDKADVQCDRRRRGLRSLLSQFSAATADTTMLIVFEDNEAPFFNPAILESMAGVNSVQPIDVADIVEISTDVEETAPPSSDSKSSSSSSTDTALIAGIAGGAGGALLVGGAVFLMRSRREESTMAVPAVQSINVADLKASLADEV